MFDNKALLLVNKHVLFKQANDILSFLTKNDNFFDFFEKQINDYETIVKKTKKDIHFSLPPKSSDISFKINSTGHVRCHYEKASKFEERIDSQNNSTNYNLSVRLVSGVGFDFSDFNIYLKHTTHIQGKNITYEEKLEIYISNHMSETLFNIKILYDELNNVTNIQMNDIDITNKHVISSKPPLKDNILIKNFNNKFNRTYKINDIKLMLLYGFLDESYKEDIEILNLTTDEGYLSYYQPNVSKTIFEIIS